MNTYNTAKDSEEVYSLACGGDVSHTMHLGEYCIWAKISGYIINHDSHDIIFQLDSNINKIIVTKINLLDKTESQKAYYFRANVYNKLFLKFKNYIK